MCSVSELKDFLQVDKQNHSFCITSQPFWHSQLLLFLPRNPHVSAPSEFCQQSDVNGEGRYYEASNGGDMQSIAASES